MKYFKIIGGFLLLMGSSKEYVNASKELLSFFDPAIILICLLMLGLSAWLIGSGISKEKLPIRSWQFAKYYGITFVFFLIIAYLNLLTYKFEPDIVKVNGMDIDIAGFMNGTKNIIPDKDKRRNYCVCVVTKLAQDENIAENYADELVKGRIDKIVIELKSTPDFDRLGLNECAALIEDLDWTPEFEQGLRESLMPQLENSEVAKTNDVNKYCDCLIEEYKKLPVKEMSNPEFYSGKQKLEIDSVCKLKSLLK
jgi:hypothetical protein